MRGRDTHFTEGLEGTPQEGVILQAPLEVYGRFLRVLKLPGKIIMIAVKNFLKGFALTVVHSNETDVYLQL